MNEEFIILLAFISIVLLTMRPIWHAILSSIIEYQDNLSSRELEAKQLFLDAKSSFDEIDSQLDEANKSIDSAIQDAKIYAINVVQTAAERAKAMSQHNKIMLEQAELSHRNYAILTMKNEISNRAIEIIRASNNDFVPDNEIIAAKFINK